MLARLLSLGLACLLLCTLAAPSFAKDKPKADTKENTPPEEAVGFVGKLEGTFVSAKKNGNLLTITITKTTPGDDSKAKDASAIVGKDVPVTVRWEKSDGKYVPMPDDQTFVKGLSKGDAVVLEVTYVDSLKVLRLTAAPAKAGDKAADSKPAAK